MYPYYSFTSAQIVQEQKIQEALKRQRFSVERETHRPALKHIFRVALAHFTASSARKPQASLLPRTGK
jgi:hypothetical protein